jgi:very-short-patch-repair endonuclease
VPERFNNLPRYKRVRRALRNEGTAAEAVLWRHLQRRQLGGRRFRRQHSVGPYVLDFYCPEGRLAVELDGAVHLDPARRAHDAAREEDLARVGIRVARFENRLVFEDIEGVLAEIEAALEGAP